MLLDLAICHVHINPGTHVKGKTPGFAFHSYVVTYVCVLFITSRREVWYILSQGIRVKLITNCHLLFNLTYMDIRVSEFAPIVIYVCILYFVFYTEKRSVKISQSIRIITMTSNFIYNRVSSIDHVKRNALTLA